VSMSVPPIVALGPLPVLRNIGILSRKGEKMPRGLRNSAPRNQLRTAMTRRPVVSKKCVINAHTSSDLSGNPSMLFHCQSERSDTVSKPPGYTSPTKQTP
jgi:hypothetical protein